jgi:hypothetical protein
MAVELAVDIALDETVRTDYDALAVISPALGYHKRLVRGVTAYNAVDASPVRKLGSFEFDPIAHRDNSFLAAPFDACRLHRERTLDRRRACQSATSPSQMAHSAGVMTR